MSRRSGSRPVYSRKALVQWGRGKLAYVAAIRSEDVSRLFPRAPRLKPGLKLFALHAADGTPILVTDTLHAAIASAERQALQPVHVH